MFWDAVREFVVGGLIMLVGCVFLVLAGVLVVWIWRRIKKRG